MTLAEYKEEVEYFYRGWERCYDNTSYPTNEKEAQINLKHLKTFVKIHMKSYKYTGKLFEKIAGERFMLDNPKYFKYDKKRK